MNLFIVGIGPGGAQHITPAAKSALAQCTHVVGYHNYLKLVEPYILEKECHGFSLGQEIDRARFCVELCVTGQDTCLVSSGDAGIYAMASLVYELLHEDKINSSESKLNIEVIPGISAMQAVAARCGAPLGHDFAVISLSDLLTPWRVIEQRLDAASRADFVLVIYNPGSKSRQQQIVWAREICLRHQAATTPVIIGRNISRIDESINNITLAELNASSVDMLSTVIIGNSQTIDTGTWVYTPRGYFQGKTKT